MSRTNKKPPDRPGLLPEDHSEIRMVSAEDREWWERLSEPAKLNVHEKYRKKWSDDETLELIRADPDSDDYYSLGEKMARTPGSLRARRSQMIHLLKDEYGFIEKAKAYFEDPKANHRLADIAQVYRVLESLGCFNLSVYARRAMARHLRQPRAGWRGDNTSAVLRERRAREEAVRSAAKAPRKRSQRKVV